MDKTVRMSMESNQQTVHIFSLEDLEKEIIHRFNKTLADFDFSDAKTLGSYYVPATDVGVVITILKDLGINGRAVVKNVSGKSYIILKGYPGNRNILTGTRYLSSNPKIIKMAIGTKAVSRSIMKGSLITLAITVPLTIADICMKDEATVGRLIGTVATDIGKVLISAGASGLAAMAVGAVTTIAAGPLIAAIFVGIAVGMALESLDQRYGITDKLVNAIDRELETLYDKTIGAIARGIIQMENILEYQIRNGLPVGKGIFY